MTNYPLSECASIVAARVASNAAKRIGVVMIVAALSASLAGAQEVSGLQAAAAIEDAMVRAIDEAEQSIVAIALVSNHGDAMREARMELLPPFGQPMAISQQNDPADPDFVPNDYATGVIIDSAGLVLTNFHAVGRDSRRYEYFVTTVERKVYRATLKAGDDKSDLAILQIENLSPGTKFKPIKFGDAKKLKKGQIVIALGNPYAIARDGQPSASWGIISNLSRRLATPKITTEAQVTLHHFGTLIQTDAKLNFGTSGGALLNLKGEMVGLTTSMAATSGYEQAAGYAIPINEGF
ncbi:MAG TPA: trypsin-like peptidase domain-containing protein, partial [Pirellulales bacterium]|nr:trypsin-like peptidase domain-containing protein [Pirellulales bacterium]